MFLYKFLAPKYFYSNSQLNKCTNYHGYTYWIESRREDYHLCYTWYGSCWRVPSPNIIVWVWRDTRIIIKGYIMNTQSTSFSSWLVKKNFWLYLFSFGIAPTGYIIKVILSHEISVEEIGALYAVISLVTILSSYNDFGMTESLNFFVPGFLEKKQYTKVNQWVATALMMQMGTSVLIGCALWFGADWLSIHYFKSQYTYDLLRVFTFFFFADNFFNTLSVFYQSAHDTFRQKSVEMIRYWSLTAYVIILWLYTPAELGDYAWWWVVGLVIGVIFSVITLIRGYGDILRQGIPKWDHMLTKKLFSYAIWVIFSANVGLLLSQIDMQMIVFLLGGVFLLLVRCFNRNRVLDK